MELIIEFIFDYIKKDILRHKLNALTCKLYEFEYWMAGRNVEGGYTPYSFM